MSPQRLVKRRRFFVQLLLLPLLYVISLPDPTLYTNVIFIAAAITVPINLTIAIILEWSSRQAPEIETLRERADDAWTLFLMSIATGATAVMSVLQRLGFQFPGRPALALLSWLAILIAVPAVGWMVTWRGRWLPEVRRRLAERQARQPE